MPIRNRHLPRRPVLRSGVSMLSNKGVSAAGSEDHIKAGISVLMDAPRSTKKAWACDPEAHSCRIDIVP
jgi:hypothetical protein